MAFLFLWIVCLCVCIDVCKLAFPRQWNDGNLHMSMGGYSSPRLRIIIIILLPNDVARHTLLL